MERTDPVVRAIPRAWFLDLLEARRSVIHLFRELDQRALLSTRLRSVIAGKAGAT